MEDIFLTQSRISKHQKKQINFLKLGFIVIIIISIIAIPLFGLSLFYNKPSNAKASSPSASNSQEKKLSTSYTNDKLVYADGQFEFDEPHFINSNTPVIVVNFKYTNKSDTAQTPESQIWNHFDVEQEVNGAIEPMGYYTINSDEPYYNEIMRSKEEVLPGESINAAYGFTLNDEASPLIIKFIDNNKKVIGTKEIMYLKELAKNNPGQEIIDDFSTDTENNATTPSQAISDMPPSWYGTAEEWEQAKLQGWTAEDYEAQIKASENESGPLQPGDPNYEEISTDETTLSGFINKYGMSPAMYKIQNEGMSEEDALRSTPDSMKTSGEIQLGHSKYGI